MSSPSRDDPLKHLAIEHDGITIEPARLNKYDEPMPWEVRAKRTGELLASGATYDELVEVADRVALRRRGIR